MSQNEQPDTSKTPPEVGRAVLEAYDLYLRSSGEEQAQLLERLRVEAPEIAIKLKRLIGINTAAGNPTLARPAIDRIQFSGGAPYLGLSLATKWRFPIMQTTFGLSFLAVTFLALVLYCWAFSLFFRFGDKRTYAGWDADWDGSRVVVTRVDPNGPVAGKLRPGDRIVAVNGDPDLSLTVVFSLPHDPALQYRLRVERQHRISDLTLSQVIRRATDRTSGQFIFFIVSAFFFATALSIALFKPDIRVAQLASTALAAEALVLLSVVVGQYYPLLSPPEHWFLYAVALPSGIHFALAYHFYAAFFADLPGSNRNSSFLRREILVILYGLGILSSCSVLFAVGAFRWHATLQWHRTLLAIYILIDSFYVFTPALICVVIVVGYLKARRALGRLRARWIAFGSLVGILPYTLYRASLLLVRWLNWQPNAVALRYTFEACILAALAIPFCSAYAVLRYKAFEIEIFVRKRLQYVLFSRSWWVLPAIPFSGMAVSLAYDRDRTVANAIGQSRAFLILSLCFGCLLGFRGKVKRWLAERYHQDEAKRASGLRNFVACIRACSSIDALVANTLRSLHLINPFVVPFIAFKNGVDDSFAITGVDQNGELSSNLQLPSYSLVIAAIERAGDALSIEAVRKAAPSAPEVFDLFEMGTDLLVPMIRRDGGILGFLVLGSRREGYLSEDLADLRVAAEEIASVYRTIEDEQARRVAETIERQQEPVVAQKLWLQECPVCGLCFDGETSQCSTDGSDLILTFAISRVINNDFQLVRRLEAGGMGTVYEGFDTKMNRRVAIKIIGPLAGNASGTLRDRASREAQSLAQLRHPNVVTAYYFGKVQSGTHYLVMEYVHGRTLRKVLASGAVSPQRAALWFDQLLDGMDAAHRAGIVHRDLKPENLMIVETENAQDLLKILDFGIAKIVGNKAADVNVTVTDFRPGTPKYMSPEQVNGRPLDQRSDLYSVGIILWEVLWGRRPFVEGATEKGLVFPAEADLNPQLKQVLSKCLAPDPELRFATVSALRSELIPLLRNYRGGGDGRAAAARS